VDTGKRTESIVSGNDFVIDDGSWTPSPVLSDIA
jgi:hypothetical protein